MDRIVELHERSARTPKKQERLHREIEATDAQIDQLVSELYGLSSEGDYNGRGDWIVEKN